MHTDNFIVLESVYGKFIIPRNYNPGPPSIDPATALLKTGRTHIEGELQNILTLVSKLEDGSIIVDGGANIGFFSIPVAQSVRNSSTKVIAFEPQRELFYALGGTCALNEIKNVYLHNLGLGASNFVANLPDVDYGKSADFGMVALTDQKETSEIPYMRYKSIEVISIDSMNLPRLDFLKLDIEGYECDALRGGINTISKYRPWIWIEYNMAGEDKIKKELESIPDLSYFILDWQNMLIAPKDRIEKSNLQLVQR